MLDPEYDLLLSPHPDDLVYSSFNFVTSKTPKLAVVFFNISGYTRFMRRLAVISSTSPFGRLFRAMVTAIRTVEDRQILGIVGCPVTYLFLPDSLSAREVRVFDLARRLRYLPIPRRLVAPLGVGGNVDHELVREVAMSLNSFWTTSELWLYEDLPYAAESARLEVEETNLIRNLGLVRAERFSARISSDLMRRKIIACKLYLTQNDQGARIASHATKKHGRVTGFAETYWVVRPG